MRLRETRRSERLMPRCKIYQYYVFLLTKNTTGAYKSLHIFIFLIQKKFVNFVLFIVFYFSLYYEKKKYCKRFENRLGYMSHFIIVTKNLNLLILVVFIMVSFTIQRKKRSRRVKYTLVKINIFDFSLFLITKFDSCKSLTGYIRPSLKHDCVPPFFVFFIQKNKNSLILNSLYCFFLLLYSEKQNPHEGLKIFYSSAK